MELHALWLQPGGKEGQHGGVAGVWLTGLVGMLAW